MKGAHYHHPRRLGTQRAWTMRSLPTGERVETSSALTSSDTASSEAAPVEGLQMAPTFSHDPVLRERIIDVFADVAPGTIIDATLGGAGHAVALLTSRADLRLVGIDRDAIARAAAVERLAPFGDRARVVAGTFSDLASVVTEVDAPVVGVLLDLGVSSPQLDDPNRGFSFRADAPLDMRMDRSTGLTAAEIIATLDLRDLADLFRHHGEGRFAMAIARSVKDAEPVTTNELVAAVERAVPVPARRRGHVATRVFQALRVVVNDEERELDDALRGAEAVLVDGGRLAVISYHSGEDRVVKSFLSDGASGGCACPVALGCVCGAVPRWRVRRNGAELATDAEIARNPRARSARLRLAERTFA